MGKSFNKKNTLNTTGLILGITLAIIFLIVRSLSKIPYDTIYLLDPSGIIPPLWILNLITLIWFFLIGYSAGSVIDSALSQKLCDREIIRIYQGVAAFIAVFFLSHIWYCIFFGGEHLLSAIFLILLGILSSALTAFFWSKILPLSALIMIGYCVWMFYIFIICASVFLHI